MSLCRVSFCKKTIDDSAFVPNLGKDMIRRCSRAKGSAGQTMKSRHFVTDSNGTSTQVAALCWRKHRDQVQVLLITSRDTGRWVLPKGWPMPGHNGPEAAAVEAWEEAGVEGQVSDQVLGLFGYDKVISPVLAHPCMVTVYPLRVATLSRRFPERKERRRKWFTADKAARKVFEPELRALFLGLDAGTITLPQMNRPKKA
jgi:8-oxo-dGTP pyrophosphatase MutT (NUDIX family)